MKRIFALFFVVLLSMFILMACENEENPLNEIDIEAVDQINVPAGIYVIPYTIEDISQLIKTYGALVTLSVTDHQGNPVTVTGNTIEIVEGEVYTVDIKIMIGEEFKQKTITITAVLPSQPIYHEVSFELNGGQGHFDTQSILSGQHAVIPSIDPVKEGYLFDGWFKDSSFQMPFIPSEMITEDIILYAKWILDTTPIYVTLTFDLQGGSGSFPNQTIEIGTYGIRPITEPVREGFVFTGWGVSLDSSQPFDFETMNLYQNTIVYAKWMEETPDVQYLVTYDLNGAFSPNPITEWVYEGDYAHGVDMTIVYEDHIFMGWSIDMNGNDLWIFDEYVVISNMTLYAIWHYDYTYINASSFFTEPSHFDDSTLMDEIVHQIHSFSIWFDAHDFELDQSITEPMIAYGLIYSKQSETPGFYDRDSIKVEMTFEELQIEQMYSFIMQLSTLPLESDTTYHVVHYVRYESLIVYSEIQTFQSYIQVSTGTAIGVLNILSGGYYKIEFDSKVFKPSIFIEVLDGYEATLNGSPYSSYELIQRSGTKSLIVTHVQSGEQYLHVFNINFRKPAVGILFNNVRTEGLSVDVSYTVTYYHEDLYTYPVNECGVLLSSSHPYLKIGMPSMTQRWGELDSSEGLFDMNNVYTPSQDYGDIYARGYVIIQGKVSYSEYVTRLTYNTAEMSYQVAAHILVTSEKVSPEYGHLVSFGTGVEYQLATLMNGELTFTTVEGSMTLSTQAQYFYMKLGSSHLGDVLVIDDFPDVIGIVEGGIYQGGVTVTYDMFNPYWYMSKDGGDYVNLPSSIRLIDPGYYVIYFRTGLGIESIYFEIK